MSEGNIMRGPLSLLAEPLPPQTDLHVLVIPSGSAWTYDPAEWRGALVVVDRGTVELEDVDGVRWTARRGDVLFLAGLPLRALHNSDQDVAVLSSISRTLRGHT